MKSGHGLFVVAGLASVLACGEARNLTMPIREGIVVTRTAEPLASPRRATIDFENLPADASSCPGPPGPQEAIDNPLMLEGVTFTDPYCLHTGYCSSPTCPTANVALILNQGATIDLPGRCRGVVIQIEGIGNVPFALAVQDRGGAVTIVEDVGIPFGTLALELQSAVGIAQIRVERVGPTTEPYCPVPPCGPLAVSSLSISRQPLDAVIEQLPHP